jgi:hypothetical protein
MQGLDNSYSCTEDFVYIGQLPILGGQIIKQFKDRLLATTEYDYGWVAKV